MSITGTCGHQLTDFEAFGLDAAIVKDLTREGKRAVSHRALCLRCREREWEMGCLFPNDYQAELWLTEDMEYL